MYQQSPFVGNLDLLPSWVGGKKERALVFSIMSGVIKIGVVVGACPK